MSKLSEGVTMIASDPSVGGVVAAVTTTSGLGLVLNYIPDDIGKLATLVGIILSTVLIRNHLRKGQADLEKTQLEINALRAKEEEREEAARLRKLSGSPTRREDD